MKLQRIGIAIAVAILLASLFPPFQITINNRVFGLGYSFIFSPPGFRGSAELSGTVDVGTLFAEFAVIVALGTLLWLVPTAMSSESKVAEGGGDEAAKAKRQRLMARAGTVIMIVLAIAAWAMTKGFVRSLFHPPSKAAVYVPPTQGGNVYEQFVEKPAQTSTAAPKMREIFPGFSVAEEVPQSTNQIDRNPAESQFWMEYDTEQAAHYRLPLDEYRRTVGR